jgi:Ser/Thr protein kinase RdoA (MazF antagonist)
VVAIDEAEGWLLMNDAGADEVGEGPAETWAEGVAALVAIQRTVGSRLDGVALEDRSPAVLAASLHALADGPSVAGFTDEVRARFRAALPRLIGACERLAELPPDMGLVHGDFHPWNVLRGSAGVVVIDWSDSALGHPFIDIPTYLGRTADPAARRALLDGWLDAWADVAPRATLEEAAMLGLVAGSLHQVESYRRIMESLEPSSTWGLDKAGHAHALRAIAWLEHGLEAEQ